MCTHDCFAGALLAAVEKLAVIARQEREQELLSQMVQVHFRLWGGGKVVKTCSSPSTLYQTARNAFPSHCTSEGPLSLYLLPDMDDISSRIKLDSEYPFSKAKMILSSPPCLLLLYLRPDNDHPHDFQHNLLPNVTMVIWMDQNHQDLEDSSSASFVQK